MATPGKKLSGIGTGLIIVGAVLAFASGTCGYAMAGEVGSVGLTGCCFSASLVIVGVILNKSGRDRAARSVLDGDNDY